MQEVISGILRSATELDDFLGNLAVKGLIRHKHTHSSIRLKHAMAQAFDWKVESTILCTG